MDYCPSQDWDRYASDLEASGMGKWITEVSKKIQAVDPYWNATEESNDAVADEDSVRWASGIKIAVPYNSDLENDDVALVVRTINTRRKLKVIRVADSEYAIFASFPSMSPEWQVIPGTAKPTQAEAQAYLDFCSSSEVVFE